MSHTDTPWSRLASRTARGLLSRKGVAYEELAEKLHALGVEDSVRAVEGKILRGSYRCSFFLQLLHALNSEYPSQWAATLQAGSTWEERAKHVFLLELSTHNLSIKQVSKRFAKVNIDIAPDVLNEQISGGNFSFILLLQLALVAPINGFERFVDARDIEGTAAESMHHVTQDADPLA